MERNEGDKTKDLSLNARSLNLILRDIWSLTGEEQTRICIYKTYSDFSVIDLRNALVAERR